jgi:hypothetical protein
VPYYLFCLYLAQIILFIILVFQQRSPQIEGFFGFLAVFEKFHIFITMLKRYSIILILLFAYTIVLGHSIIPHHHHDDEHESEQVSHHHDAHEDDHHDSEEENLAHDFENYLHSGDTGDFHQQPDIKVSFNSIATVYLLSTFTFQIKAAESPPPLLCLSKNYIPNVQHCLSSKGLRAPPCTLV